MKVELLHIVDCPNATIAEENVRRALDALGLIDMPIDLFPTQPVRMLACRV